MWFAVTPSLGSSQAIFFLVVPITKCLMLIGSLPAYLLSTGNWKCDHIECPAVTSIQCQLFVTRQLKLDTNLLQIVRATNIRHVYASLQGRDVATCMPGLTCKPEKCWREEI